MPILKEPIASRVKGSLGEKEDWWWLCYDTENDRFYVEHEWDHVKQSNLAQSSGASQFDVGTWTGEGANNIPEAMARLKERASI